MAQWLKQSTAATIKMGPFVDDTDGKTAETGLSIAQANIRLTKNGAAFAQTHNATGGTHDENGYYGIPLDTTDTDTLGRLRVAILITGALPVWQDFVVVAANIFDSLIGGGDVLDVSCTQWLGTAILSPGTAGTPDVNAKLIGGTSQTGRDIGASVLISAGTGAGQISLSSGTVTVGTNNDKTGYTASTVSDKTGYSLTVTPPTAAAIADAVLDEAGAGHTGLIPTNLDAKVSVSGASAAAIDSQLSGTHGAGMWGGAGGSGSTSTTITINDGINPLDGVNVWVTTDAGGTNVVASGYTGALGTVTFLLDAGTYYVWKQLSGYNFTNPQSMVVT